MIACVYVYIDSLMHSRDSTGEMDLEKSLAEAKAAVNYFFNNKFTEAKELMQPWYVDQSILFYA